MPYECVPSTKPYNILVFLLHLYFLYYFLLITKHIQMNSKPLLKIPRNVDQGLKHEL